GARELPEMREGVSNIEDGKKFSADRMTVIIVRAEFAFAETAHGCGSAVKKTLVDGDGRSFVRTAVGKGMDDAGTRTKGDRRLVDPFLETTFDGLIDNQTGCERFWSKRQIVADAHRATD